MKGITMLGIIFIFGMNSCTTTSQATGSRPQSRPEIKPENSTDNKNESIVIDYPTSILSTYSSEKIKILNYAEQKVYDERIKNYGYGTLVNSPIYLIKALTTLDSTTHQLKFIYLLLNTEYPGYVEQKIIANPNEDINNVSFPTTGNDSMTLSAPLEKDTRTATELINSLNVPQKIDAITISDQFTVFKYGLVANHKDYFLINLNTLELISIIVDNNGNYVANSNPAIAGTLLKK